MKQITRAGSQAFRKLPKVMEGGIVNVVLSFFVTAKKAPLNGTVVESW